MVVMVGHDPTLASHTKVHLSIFSQIINQQTMKSLLKLSLLLSFVFAFAACGGGGDTAETAEPAMDMQEDGVRTVEIIGTDDMRFAVADSAEGLVTEGMSKGYMILKAIEAAPGEELRITLSTESMLPATAMSHNFALLTLGADTDGFARASITARDNAYISPDFADQVIVHTAMLGSGESDTITFTVPSEPGEYDYICSFPGHYAGGMVGKLIVQ